LGFWPKIHKFWLHTSTGGFLGPPRVAHEMTGGGFGQ
jgi:hypothetical protein